MTQPPEDPRSLGAHDDADNPEPNAASTPTETKQAPGSSSPGKKARSTGKPRQFDADGRFRPAFLLNFPDDPDLNRLVAAFEYGDYRAVRRDATKLAESATSLAVKEAAQELFRRVEPDPTARRLLWVALGLFAFLLLWTYGIHGH